MTLRALCIAVSLISLLAMSGCGGSSGETTETGNKSTAYSRCVTAKLRALMPHPGGYRQPPRVFDERFKAAMASCAHSLVRSGRYTPAEVKKITNTSNSKRSADWPTGVGETLAWLARAISRAQSGMYFI